MRHIACFFQNFERYFVIVTLAVMSILILFQVVMRYIFESSLSWSEEVVRWLFVWFIWVGISYGIQLRRHVSVTVLVEFLPKTAQRVLAVFVYLAMIAFFARMSHIGFLQVTNPNIVRQFSTGIYWPSGEQVGMVWFYASMPVGTALTTIRLIQALYEDFIHPGAKAAVPAD